MRYEKSVALVALAKRLAGTAEGLTLDEMAGEMDVDRRTAERMRDALRALFPALEEIRCGRGKRFRIRGGLDSFLQAPNADELAELDGAARALEASGGGARAAHLRSLSAKVRAALRADMRRRIEPDLDALTDAAAFIVPAGPRPLADAETMRTLRDALKAPRLLRFTYVLANGETRERRVAPYGVLFGKAYYLVGPQVGQAEPVLWRLDRMSAIALDAPFAGPSEGFSLSEFAARSFGAFQEEPADIVLRFGLAAAADAKRFVFHPTQTVEALGDGSLVVRFRAGGLLELVRHLFTWGDAVEIVAPERLRELMVSELRNALARHAANGQPACVPISDRQA